MRSVLIGTATVWVWMGLAFPPDYLERFHLELLVGSKWVCFRIKNHNRRNGWNSPKWVRIGSERNQKFEVLKEVKEDRSLMRSEWPSGQASSISLTAVKHGCILSENGWATFQMNIQNNSFRRPSEGTLNYGSHAWMRHA